MKSKNIYENGICRERIVKLRKGICENREKSNKAISQDSLAALFRTKNCKISRDTIEDIESRVRDIFDIEVVWFARVFDVSTEYLTGISDDASLPFDASDAAVDTSVKNAMNICGKHVSEARKRFPGKMSQTRLAELMNERGFDFKYFYILKIEKGRRRVLLSELKALADILGQPLMYFFKGCSGRLPNIESYESYAAQDD